MKFKLKNLTTVIPVIKDTVLRFPLVMICVFSATILSLLIFHNIVSFGKENNIHAMATLILSGLSLVSLKLLVESKSWSRRNHLVGAAIVVTVINLFTWEIIVNAAGSVYLFLSLAVILTIIFAPYIKQHSSMASVWYFNYQTGVAVFFAAVATAILGAGLSLILVSSAYLFEIKIPGKLYGDVWILSWGILFSIYFLANISKEFDFKEDSCGFPRGIRFITNYIMVPLMWAYMAILYAYVFKIIFQWELPRGNLGWMITTFGTVGIVTKLLAYPIRNEGTFLLKLFDKYYYYALVIPIILLGVAIGVRINDYGLTESRYGVVLLGIWFSSVAIITFIKKEQFHIKYVPMLVALLAFFASFGPWGAVELSLNSQLTRFKTVLDKHGLLVDNQAVKTKGQLSFDERKSLSSIADYLSQRQYRYDRIKPMFENLIAETERKKKENEKKIKKSSHQHISTVHRGEELLGMMGIDYVNRWTKVANDSSFSYYSNAYRDLDTNMLPVSGYDYIGKGYMSSYSNKEFKIYTITHNGKKKPIQFDNDGENILIHVDNDRAIFNYKKFTLDLRNKGIVTKTTQNNHHFIVDVDSEDNRFKVKLNIESIHGKATADNNIKVNSLHYLFLLKFN